MGKEAFFLNDIYPMSAFQIAAVWCGTPSTRIGQATN